MTQSILSRRNRILGGLWGSLVGDALGVPVEFKDRATVQADPVTDMRGFGTHHQPPGTWSDDGAMILCSIESLTTSTFDTEDMGRRFVRWMKEGHWTANGDVFDVGGTTSYALGRIANGVAAEEAGGRDEFSNGNGSLMRILPVVLRLMPEPMDGFLQKVERASAITHGHERAKMACALFGMIIRQLVAGHAPKTALGLARKEFTHSYERVAYLHFRRLLEDDIPSLAEDRILSTGHVLHTLHASLWCLLTTTSFSECVLKAVNLGGDTDTTGCVAGGLAGVHYGLSAIPAKWRKALARHDEIDTLFSKFVDICDARE